MNKKHHFFYRAKNATEALNYGVTTVAGAVTVLTLGMASAALAITIVGIPPALLISGLAYGAAAGTEYSARKAHRKGSRALNLDHESDSEDDELDLHVLKPVKRYACRFN